MEEEPVLDRVTPGLLLLQIEGAWQVQQSMSTKWQTRHVIPQENV
jgi:hypothetical protein